MRPTSVMTMLGNLIRSSANADTALEREMIGAEIRAFALEPETLAALVDVLRQDEADIRAAIDDCTDEELGERLGKTIKKSKGKNAEVQADVERVEAQNRADDLARTIVRTGTYEYTLDVDALLYAAAIGRASKRLCFTIEQGVTLDVDTTQLRAIAREAKAQKWTVTARLVWKHTQEIVQSRTKFDKRGWGSRHEFVASPAMIDGWALVIEYVRPSGTRGSLRFKHNLAPKAGMVLSVVHVGIEANDTRAA